ncbi:MAG TPA: hypothetical protein VF044_10290, partial [Actinomycetota bacterium]
AIVTELVSDLQGVGLTVVRKGDRIGIARNGTTDTFTVARAIVPTGSASVAAATTRVVQLTGPVNAGDTWTLSVAGGALAPYEVAASASNANAVATAFASAANGLTGYTAFAVGSTVYLTKLAAGAFTLAVDLARNDEAAVALVSGTPKLSWLHEIQLLPSLPGAAEEGDRWTLVIGTSDPYVVVADGGDSVADIVDALIAEIDTDYLTERVGNVLRVRQSSGAPLAIEPVTQLRPKAYTAVNEVEDNRDHYLKIVVELAGDEATGGYSAGEIWTIQIDGFLYSFTVPTGTQETRNLRTIAQGLVDAVNLHAQAALRPFRAVLAPAGAVIRVEDKDVDEDLPGTPVGDDPFTFEVKRGGGIVRGVFDIDGANVVEGSINVPVILPGYEDLVAAFPFFRFLFERTDVLRFRARPVLQLIGTDGTTVLHTSTGNLAGVDPGSSTNVDPYFEFTFNSLAHGPGTYFLKVSSLIDWDDTTLFLGIPNTFRADGLVGVDGVAPGQSYDLLVSLQRHATNPDAITLVNKTITIIEGTGTGQTATIEAYDPETRRYTLDREWTISPDATSRFQISQALTYNPLLDEYQVILTGSPGVGEHVIVNVVPRPTRTYNSDQAFDADANFGENEELQVKVRTGRAVIGLQGQATIGEKWVLSLRAHPTEGAVAEFFFKVEDSGDLALSAIADDLRRQVNDHADYDAVLLDGDNTAFVVSGVGGTAFYTDFRIMIDTDPTAGENYVPESLGGSEQQAEVRLSGRPAADETWTLTVDGTAYSYVTSARDDLAAIALRLGGLLPTLQYEVKILGSAITIGRRTGGAATVALSVSGGSAGGGSVGVALELTGHAAQNEVWSLRLDGGAPINYTVGFGDTLASIARGLALQIPVATYEVNLLGRTISVARRAAGLVGVQLAMSPDSRGGAEIVHQLYFDELTWNVPQTVQVFAIDDDFIDGGDALVFPPFEERVNAVRGPVLIDGGVRVAEERFLNTPLMLPGEKNVPIPNGTVGGVGSTQDGRGTVSDPNATHVSAAHGERPGFDPRMNDFAFIFGFLNGPAGEIVLDVDEVDGDILSLATADNTKAFRVGYQLLRPGVGSVPGAVEFSGTPHRDDLASIDWTQAVIQLDGLAKTGEIWTLTLGGTDFPHLVAAGENSPATVARAIAADARLAGYDVELRVGLLGDTKMIVRKAGTTFTADFEVTPVSVGAPVDATNSVGGTPLESDIAGARWIEAAWRLLTAGATGDEFRITLTRGATAFTASHTVGADPHVEDATADLAADIDGSAFSELDPLVSGSRVTFTTPFPAGQAPLGGNEYYVKPFNLNFRVVESDQVDTLNVFHGNSPADDVGVLTSTRLTGLGMGGDTVIADRLIPGGITYANLEALNIELGFGADDFTIESTHAGSTTVKTGRGGDQVLVKTIDGHTTIVTGDGNDHVTVSNDETLVDQITALLTLDLGAGDDTITVDDSGDGNHHVGILT